MCNLYDVGPPPKKTRFDWEKKLVDRVGDITYVAPKRPGLVVTLKERRKTPQTMLWGFQRSFQSKGESSERCINNTRHDKIGGKMWGKAFRDRRCLIPALRFYEWSGPKGNKTKHSISLDGDHWMWIAGLWCLFFVSA